MTRKQPRGAAHDENGPALPPSPESAKHPERQTAADNAPEPTGDSVRPPATSKALDLPALLASDRQILVRFLDTIGDALFVVNAKQQIVYWNRRAVLLTGFEEDEVLGRHCLTGIRCEHCLYECKLFDQETVEQSHVTLRTKDGRTLQVNKSAFVLHDAAGTVVGGVELLRDETELAERIQSCRSQAAEIETRERLQSAILGSIREGVVTIDQEFRISSYSRRAEAITGLKATQVLGHHCHDVLGSRLCDEDCPAQHCLDTGDLEADRTTEIITASGQRLPIAEIAVPLRGADGEALGSVLVLEDRQAANEASKQGAGATFEGIIGRSKAMRRVFQIIDQVAPTDVTVLLTGESGTGKELAARAIHARSSRRHGPFQAINCAALPDTLLESELFGHVRGAFTGAERNRAGSVETAEGGSLFLDEVGEMSLSLQAKLLRFLQEREYQRVGDSQTRSSDVRLLAATNRDLKEEVATNRFREDLYYRIRVIPIEMPPLRDRTDDIPILATRLLSSLAKARGRPELILSPAAMQHMVSYHWPGNVRELINTLEYAIALSPGRRVRAVDLPPELSGKTRRYSASKASPEEEADRIRDALKAHNGNRSRTARYLGMDRVTLYRKMKKFGLS